MRRALPAMAEEAEALKRRLPREHDGRKKAHLQMLSLLASGQGSTRREVSGLLVVHRHTMGHWLAIYASGGLAALLALYVPAGRVCFGRSVAAVGPADRPSGGPLPPPRYDRPHRVQDHAQGATVQPHKKTLTHGRSLKRPARSGCRASSRPRTASPHGCSVTTKATLGG
jgi:hypothetical protein